jgi:hypothetical protein
VSESFVDLTYRGLPLGRRIKLTEIRPGTGYLELPAPMPVGTRLAIATDEGPAIEAIVTGVHEQAAGTERAPGMRIAPVLDDAAAASWWSERVALPELEPPAASSRPGRVTVQPRTHAASSPPVHGDERAASEAAAAPAAGIGGGAVEPGLLASEAEPPIVDDGKKTVMMESVDLGALGLEAGASGQLAAGAAAAAEGGAAEGGDAEDAEDAEDAGDGGGAGHATPAGTNGDPSQPVLPADRPPPPGKKRKKRG